MLTLITRRSFLLASSTLLVARRWPMPASRQPKFFVTLTAKPSKSSYSSTDNTDRVTLALALTNDGPESVRLTNRIDGTLKIKSLTVDGVAVPTRVTAADFYTELGYYLKRSLVTVVPGQTLPMDSWRSTRDRVFGAQGIGTIQYAPGGENDATIYFVGKPGTYVLTLVYQFPPTLDDGTSPLVAIEESTPATVSFVVT